MRNGETSVGDELQLPGWRTAGAKGVEGEVRSCFGTSAKTLSPHKQVHVRHLKRGFSHRHGVFGAIVLISKLRRNSHVGGRQPEDGAARSADAQAGCGYCQHK